jgi:hypothetical protein
MARIAEAPGTISWGAGRWPGDKPLFGLFSSFQLAINRE